MRGKKDRSSLTAHGHQAFQKLFHADRVEALARLVQNQQGRPARKSQQQSQLGTHSFGERFDLSLRREIEFPQQPVWAKSESYDRAIAHWPETLLVVFTDPVCLYCRIVEPVVADLARGKAGKLKVMKVDTESETDLAQRFKIEKTPTFIVYKNGGEVIRVDGAPKDKTDLVTWIENLITFTSY